MRKKILIVDSEKSIHDLFQILFKKMSVASSQSSKQTFFYDIVSAKDSAQAVQFLQKQSFDLVIADLKPAGVKGLELLKQAKELQPKIIFIIITTLDHSETAVQAMKLGAYHYMLKPFNVEAMKSTILSALDSSSEGKGESSQEDKGASSPVLPDKKEGGRDKEAPRSIREVLVGESPAMKKIVKDIEQISHSVAHILITGESGTGKEVIAREVHKAGPLKKKPFMAVNCGAISPNLIESEMFGHKKGSFTGAVADKKGFFELADRGVLFLDEIGELPLEVQPKLLRVLQEKTVRMVGGTNDKKVNVRLISATNRDLEKMVQQGSFREDLFYRLNVVRIHIPPLRERKEDIPSLVKYFVKKYSTKKEGSAKGISPSAMRVFQQYDYPGNIRELENLIERVIILGAENQIEEQDVLSCLAEEEKKSKLDISLPVQGMDLEEMIEKLEKNLLIQALQRTQGLKKPAAALLKLSLRAFRYRLHKYQLSGFVSEKEDDY